MIVFVVCFLVYIYTYINQIICDERRLFDKLFAKREEFFKYISKTNKKRLIKEICRLFYDELCNLIFSTTNVFKYKVFMK